MFKKLSLIALFAIIPFCGHSQEQEEDKTSNFGFTAGFIDSEFQQSRLNDRSDRIYDPFTEIAGSGLFLGLTYDKEFNEKFGLASEFLYADLEESQLRLSSQLKYNLFNTGLYLMAGPEINYLTSVDQDRGDLDNPNKFGLNITGGLGYNINNRISVYFKYSHEITNRYRDATNDKRDVNGELRDFRLGLKFKF